MCPISYSNTRPNTWRIFKASRQYNWEDFGKLGLCNMASQLVYWSATFCWFGGSRNLIFSRLGARLGGIFVATQLKQRHESSWIIFLSFRVRRSLWNTTYPPVPPKNEGWNLNAAPFGSNDVSFSFRSVCKSSVHNSFHNWLVNNGDLVIPSNLGCL